jgi:hypothetical protein
VVDLGTLRALNAAGGERLANLPGEMDELVEIGSFNRIGVMFDQKKPVAAPGNVAGHQAVSGHIHVDCGGPAVAVYVFECHRAVFVQRGSHDAYRGLDTVLPGLDPTQIRERGYNADCSVPAHAQASTVVEENYARDAVRIGRLAEQCAHYRFGSTRLGNESPAERFVILLEEQPALPQVAGAEVRASFDDGSGRFAAGMRIDNPDYFQKTLLFRFLSKIVSARVPGRGE